MQAKGVAAVVDFDGQAVTITRGALSPQGGGTKTIPLRQITAVQFKSASLLTRADFQALADAVNAAIRDVS